MGENPLESEDLAGTLSRWDTRFVVTGDGFHGEIEEGRWADRFGTMSLNLALPTAWDPPYQSPRGARTSRGRRRGELRTARSFHENDFCRLGTTSCFSPSWLGYASPCAVVHSEDGWYEVGSS